MAVDYVRLLEELGIDHDPRRETGRRIYVACPFCGQDDPSAHLGILKDGTAWGCLRDDSHRGRSPFRLIRALSGWSYDQIAAYIGGSFSADSLEALGKKIATWTQPETTHVEPLEEIVFPPEFIKLENAFNQGGDSYLRIARGFKKRTTRLGLAARYDLRFPVTGRFAYRIVIPVRCGGRLYGWTARSIGKTGLRYLAHPQGDQIKRTLYNIDNARGGLVLVVVEGPFDVIKFDWFARRFGINAVAIMGTSLTPEQEWQVWEASKRYKHVVVMLDSTAMSMALRVMSQLRPIHPILGTVPDGYKDPGDMSPTSVKRWCERTLVSLDLW